MDLDEGGGGGGYGADNDALFDDELAPEREVSGVALRCRRGWGHTAHLCAQAL